MAKCFWGVYATLLGAATAFTGWLLLKYSVLEHTPHTLPGGEEFRVYVLGALFLMGLVSTAYAAHEFQQADR